MQVLSNLAELKARRPSKIEVPVEQWGFKVVVNKLPALEKIEITERFEDCAKRDDGALQHQADALEFAAELLARSLTNTEGAKLFDSDEGRDFLRLEDPGVLQPLLDEAIRLSGLGPRDESKKN